MGFSSAHIRIAMRETRVSAAASPHNATVLATWMLEHPHVPENEDPEEQIQVENAVTATEW